MQLVLDTMGLKVSVRNDCFLVQSKTTKRLISPQRVSSIVVNTTVLISSKVLLLASQYDIPFSILPTAHEPILILSMHQAKHAELRQCQWLNQQHTASFLFVKKCIELKVELQKNLLLKLAHTKSTPTALLKSYIQKMEGIAKSILLLENDEQKSWTNSLMGYEGSIAKIYWQSISESLPAPFRFEKRSRRPATDLFNASLNYLYALLESTVQASILSCRLDPFCGILHTTAHAHKALVYDLMEPFRPWIDRLVIELILENSLTLTLANEAHTQKGVLLTKEQRKLLVMEYNGLLETKRKWQNQVSPVKNHILNLSAQFAKLQLNINK